MLTCNAGFSLSALSNSTLPIIFVKRNGKTNKNNQSPLLSEYIEDIWSYLTPGWNVEFLWDLKNTDYSKVVSNSQEVLFRCRDKHKIVSPGMWKYKRRSKIGMTEFLVSPALINNKISRQTE